MRLSATLVAVNVSAMNIFTSIFTEAERQVLNDLLFIQSRDHFTKLQFVWRQIFTPLKCITKETEKSSIFPTGILT